MTELARLEHTALASDHSSDQPSPEKVHQWQALFHYSYEQAVETIKQRTANIGRLVITDAVWEELREANEAQGFDKDAYEHFLEVQPNNSSSRVSEPPSLSQGTAPATYLLKLEERLSDPGQVQTLIGSTKSLKLEADEDNPNVRFCRVSAQQRSILLAKLPFHSTFIRLSLSSNKDFDSNSKYPTLGIESTLPQHRLAASEQALPSQDQYPVWYFFYGNLATPSTLSKRLSVPEEEIELKPARITGGVMSSWGGKYRALLDGDGTLATTVDGFGFLVRTHDVEDTLRMYETDRYEVVRCHMTFKDSMQKVSACTFKFLG